MDKKSLFKDISIELILTVINEGHYLTNISDLSSRLSDLPPQHHPSRKVKRKKFPYELIRSEDVYLLVSCN